MSTAAARKPHLNMIVVGHIDNGKSTTMGHFSWTWVLLMKELLLHMQPNPKRPAKETLSSMHG